jgi:hypothetical protein
MHFVQHNDLAGQASQADEPMADTEDSKQRLVDRANSVRGEQRPLCTQEPATRTHVTTGFWVVNGAHELAELVNQARLAMRQNELSDLILPHPSQVSLNANEHLVCGRLGRQTDEQARTPAHIARRFGDRQRGLRLPLAHGRFDNHQGWFSKLAGDGICDFVQGPRRQIRE